MRNRENEKIASQNLTPGSSFEMEDDLTTDSIPTEVEDSNSESEATDMRRLLGDNIRYITKKGKVTEYSDALGRITQVRTNKYTDKINTDSDTDSDTMDDVKMEEGIDKDIVGDAKIKEGVDIDFTSSATKPWLTKLKRRQNKQNFVEIVQERNDAMKTSSPKVTNIYLNKDLNGRSNTTTTGLKEKGEEMSTSMDVDNEGESPKVQTMMFSREDLKHRCFKTDDDSQPERDSTYKRNLMKAIKRGQGSVPASSDSGITPVCIVPMDDEEMESTHLKNLMDIRRIQNTRCRGRAAGSDTVASGDELYPR